MGCFFGMFAFKLNLLLYLVALNQRFDLLAKEFQNSDSRKYEQFSTLQDCVINLNLQYGLQFGWIVLFDFMSILVVFYSLILNLVLRESDAEWSIMFARCSVCVSLLSSICWSAGQLSEKVSFEPTNNMISKFFSFLCSKAKQLPNLHNVISTGYKTEPHQYS
jgi:hypothetical protein